MQYVVTLLRSVVLCIEILDQGLMLVLSYISLVSLARALSKFTRKMPTTVLKFSNSSRQKKTGLDEP